MRMLLTALMFLQAPSAPTLLAIALIDCSNPIPDHFLVNGNGQLTKVYGPVVPQSEVWLMYAGGLFSRGPQIPADNTEWMMELIEVAPETGFPDTSGDDAQIGLCCHRIPFAKQPRTYATPVLGWTGHLLLMPGRRIAGRTNNAIDIGIGASYLRFPAACAAQLVGIR